LTCTAFEIFEVARAPQSSFLRGIATWRVSMVDELLTAEPVEGRAGLWPGAPPSPPLLRLRWEAAHSTLGCGLVCEER